MRVGGGLSYVVGPMGSGKSYYGVREIVRRVIGSQYVVTNVELYENAAERIAMHYAPFSRRNRRRIADKVKAFYIYETDLAEAIRYRIPGRGEARAGFVWDETHNDLNNRNWRERQQRYQTEAGTDALLEWATQLRKLGYAGYLLSQHHENTDAALRRVCSYIVRLQNQREQTRLLGLRVTPWPLFLAVWMPSHVPIGSPGKPVKVERYFLGWQRHLYDTEGLYHGVSADETAGNVIRLPAGGRAPARALPPAEVDVVPGEAVAES